MPKTPPEKNPKKERLSDAIKEGKNKPKKKYPPTPPTTSDNEPNPNDPPC